MGFKDILQALLMGGGGFAQSFGQGLQRRDEMSQNYMNDLQKLYFTKMMEQQDPYRQKQMQYLDYQMKQPQNTGEERILDQYSNIKGKELEQMFNERNKPFLSGEVAGPPIPKPNIDFNDQAKLNVLEDKFNKTSSSDYEIRLVNQAIKEKETKLGRVLSSEEKIKLLNSAKRPDSMQTITDLLSQTDDNKKIRVRVKATGETGTIDSNEYDPNIYELL